MDNKQPRKRAVNFSQAEKIILTDLVAKHKNILENKRSDNVTLKDKEYCWKTIEKAFNSISSIEFRSSKVLKSCWNNLKKKTRKFFAEERIKLYKTGGGSCETRSDVIMERVRDLIKPSVDGLLNSFDNDAIESSEALYETPVITNTRKYKTTFRNTKLFEVPTVTNTNLYEMTNTVAEYLEDNNVMDEDLCENDIQVCLNTQNINETRNCAENQLNTPETNNYNYENQNINKTDDYENNFNFANNNKTHPCPTKKVIKYKEKMCTKLLQ